MRVSADFLPGVGGEGGKDLGGDDVEAGLLPVAVGLFEGVDLLGGRSPSGEKGFLVRWGGGRGGGGEHLRLFPSIPAFVLVVA